MANIVITSTTEYIKVVYNTKVTSLEIAYISRSDMLQVDLAKDDDFVQVVTTDVELQFSWDDANAPEVDSVDAVAPTSNADLATKLAALMKV